MTERLKKLARKVRRRVLRERSYGLDHERDGRITLSECRQVAELARCDWLYNCETEEARFFEFM